MLNFVVTKKEMVAQTQEMDKMFSYVFGDKEILFGVLIKEFSDSYCNQKGQTQQPLYQHPVFQLFSSSFAVALALFS